MIFKAGIWMLLIAYGTSFELLDEARPIDLDDINYYNDVNYQDPEQLEIEFMKDLLMHKLFNPTMNMDGLTMHYGFANMPNAELWGDLSELKGAMMKRPSKTITTSTTTRKTENSGNDVNSVKPVIRKQPKWKAKKGRKVGSQMVCYFKLCAFRPPV